MTTNSHDVTQTALNHTKPRYQATTQMLSLLLQVGETLGAQLPQRLIQLSSAMVFIKPPVH